MSGTARMYTAPLLFNKMFKKVLEDINETISINETFVNNLRYADGIIRPAEKRERL